MSQPSGKEAHGSIPLVLLVVIVIGGLVVALFGIVRTGTSAVGRDRDFGAAIQVADAGIQDAYLALLAIDDVHEDVGFEPCPRPTGLEDDVNDIDNGICSSADSEFEDGGFVYEYTRIGESRNWQIRSWGTYRDSTRAIVANAGVTPLFTTAMLANEDLTLNAAAQCDPLDPFSVGSGGEIDFNGQSGDCIKAIRIFNSPLGATVPGSKFGTFDVRDCEDGESDGCITYSLPEELRELMENRAEQEFLSGVCSEGALPLLPRTGGVIELERGETYCINANVELGKDDPVTLQGSEGFARVVVDGSLSFLTQAEVNIDGEAGGLVFDVSGRSVIIQGNAEVRAGIYAPEAVCVSNGGSGFFSGAMTCAEIEINGNWRYDSSVRDIEGSAFGIRNWAEVPPEAGPPVEIETAG